LTEEFWATILATNLLGPFRCTRAAASALKAARGAVCNTASVAGRNMAGSSMGYGARKGGLITPTQTPGSAAAPDTRETARAARPGVSPPARGGEGGGPRQHNPLPGPPGSGAPAGPPISPPRSFFCAPTPAW